MDKIVKQFKSIVKKKYAVPVILTCVAILLVLIPSNLRIDNREESGKNELKLLSEQLENRVEEMCERVKGVDNVYVMLTLDTSEEYVYAQNTENTDSLVKSQLVLSEAGGVERYIVYPKVRGVAVVCDGGDKGTIQKILSELISSALSIPVSSITIAGT